ncbi:MAG: dipeptidase [Eubacteriales bacterium]|nr:dipeptidase [Eubacteriales bacterium]
MNYIDLHSDTITMLRYPKEDLQNNRRMVKISALQQGGAMIQCFSDFVPTGHYPKPLREISWKTFQRIADKKDALLALHADCLMPVLDTEDIVLCRDIGKIGVIFTSEDLGVIGSDLKKIDRVYRRGVRIASLTWNHENDLGFPNSKKAWVMQKGLKPFGLQAVRRMNELGIVVDVSHLSDGGFWDVIHYSKKPVAATHSNCRALAGHPRNLTDEMIKALADKGGVMGLNFAPAFLSERGDGRSLIQDMVRHAHHIRNVGGSDVLAIGTDFDGIRGKLEIADPSGMTRLFDALKKSGFPESDIENMFYRNVLRVLKENW